MLICDPEPLRYQGHHVPQCFDIWPLPFPRPGVCLQPRPNKECHSRYRFESQPTCHCFYGTVSDPGPSLFVGGNLSSPLDFSRRRKRGSKDNTRIVCYCSDSYCSTGKKTFNADSPSFTPAGQVQLAKKSTLSSQAASAAPFTPRGANCRLNMDSQDQGPGD